MYLSRSDVELQKAIREIDEKAKLKTQKENDNEEKGIERSLESETSGSESRSNRSKVAIGSEKEGDNMEIYDDSGAIVIDRSRDLMGGNVKKSAGEKEEAVKKE